MAKQTNTPEDWRILAERDMTVADHLAKQCQQVKEGGIKKFLTRRRRGRGVVVRKHSVVLSRGEPLRRSRADGYGLG
jgi:hypothetical protein